MNRIIDVVAKRIKRAIDDDKEFIAFIVLPLLPGFGGNITKADGKVLRI